MAGAKGELPGAVLFACNLNAVRSPMAEALMKYLFGRHVYVDSCGVRAGEINPFVIAVMDEIGIDLSGHKSKSFESLQDSSFDLVISLSPEAQHQAVEMTRTTSTELAYWPTMDPTYETGSRDQRMEAFRATRDDLLSRIRAYFDFQTGPQA